MPKDLAIDILAELPVDNDLSGSEINKADVPANVRSALDGWISSVNITFDDIEDKVMKASYFDNEREYYVFSFYNDDAEIFTGKVIIQEDVVVGESSMVSS